MGPFGYALTIGDCVCGKLYPVPLMKDMLVHLAKGKVFTKLDLHEAYNRESKQGMSGKCLLITP